MVKVEEEIREKRKEGEKYEVEERRLTKNYPILLCLIKKKRKDLFF